MIKKIYSINFSRLTGDEFYFAATSKQVEKIEKEAPAPAIVDASGWDNDEDGRKFLARVNKHLFTYPEIRNKIRIYQNWGKN